MKTRSRKAKPTSSQQTFGFMQPATLSKPAPKNLVDVGRLRSAQRDSLRVEPEDKITIVLRLMLNAGSSGLTCREMFDLTGRGINCWTQPFFTLREEELITTNGQRRNGGTVHVLTEEGRQRAEKA